MAVQVSYPGIYIDEFAPGAPINGVGTNTAAFLGPTMRGEIAGKGDPRLQAKITSWDQFLATYGEAPLPGFQLWYAVRGFFENGGQVCYVARVSNGDYQSLMLKNRGQTDDIIRVRARQPGIPTTDIKITVAAKTLLTAATSSLYQPTGKLAAPPAGRDVTLGVGEGARFRPGDTITIAAAGERAGVVRVSGDTLRVDADFTGVYAAGNTVRLADAAPGTRTLRIQSTAANASVVLVPGTMLTITQGAAATSAIVDSVQPEFLGGGKTSYRVTFRQALPIPLSMDPANTATVNSEEFDFTVAQGTSTVYVNLTMDAAHPRYYLRVVNDDLNALVRLEPVEPAPPLTAPDNLPVKITAISLGGGGVEKLGSLSSNDYIAALDSLRSIRDVNLVAAPDASVPKGALDPATVQQAMITHCEQLGNRFAVLDAKPALAPFGGAGVEGQRLGLDSSRGYAALYYPWIRVRPATSGDPILVPPSGHVCGIIARSDATRGVHKAPANEIVNGALGAERTMSDIDQGLLNLQNVNVIRVFSTGARPMLWGARTTSRDTNWQYVNIRRLFLFLEGSIEEGIRWAVFEPNNLALWQKLKRTITEFLTRAWRDGALFGEKPEDAFYVRIDDVLNPFSEQALGRLHIEIGVRPSYPAEFIIVRIGIWAGGSETTES